MERDDEIAQLKHELEILRLRYVIYERGGRRLRLFFIVILPLAVVLISIRIFSTDALMGIFILCMLAVVGVLCWLAGRGGISWADMASMSISRLSMPSAYRPWLIDARLLQYQIAEREQRLAELGVLP